MINYEILNSCDKLLIGNYKTGHNYILFSNIKNYYTYIQDPSFSNFELTISSQNILELITTTNDPIILNDKKFMGKMKLKNGDLILSGATTIKITDFKFSPKFSHDEEFLDLIKDESSKKLLKSIEKKLISSKSDN